MTKSQVRRRSIQGVMLCTRSRLEDSTFQWAASRAQMITSGAWPWI